eukprot:sb/3465416/
MCRENIDTPIQWTRAFPLRVSLNRGPTGPTERSKQPIRTRYLGHVTGYQPIRCQCFLIRSVPGRKTKSFGDRLLLFLNSIDITVCLTAFLKIVIRYELRSTVIYENKGKDPPPNTLYNAGVISFIAALAIERIAAELSGIATIIMSVSRTIGVWMPFYQINRMAIVVFAVIYTVVMTTREAFRGFIFNWDTYMFSPTHRREINSYHTYLEIEYWIRIAVFLSIVAVLFVSTLLTVIKLFTSINAPARRLSRVDATASKEETARTQAIITIVILAVASFIFNGYFITVQLLDKVARRELTQYSWWSSVFKSAIYLAISLNSMINPGIYVFRIRAIRTFWWRVICRRRATNESDTSHVVANPLTTRVSTTSQVAMNAVARTSRVSSTIFVKPSNCYYN